jgi:REP element-mobilizing transposase RayT
MSRKYKFKNPEGIFFITFSVVGWVDIFTRDLYRNILIESFNWCIKNKGLVIYAWVIMTNHVHMIVSKEGNNNLEDIMRDLKKFTSVKIIESIKSNIGESRKEWMLRVFKEAGEANSQNTNYQFWQHGNHPIELDNNKIIEQKLEYLHNNPVEAGFSNEKECYNWSSAMDYAGIKGLVNVELLW